MWRKALLPVAGPSPARWTPQVLLQVDLVMSRWPTATKVSPVGARKLPFPSHRRNNESLWELLMGKRKEGCDGWPRHVRDGSPSLERLGMAENGSRSRAPLPPVHTLLLAGVSHIPGPSPPRKPRHIHLSTTESCPCLPLQRFSFCCTK